jgi:CRP-like cAMP-binding protein
MSAPLDGDLTEQIGSAQLLELLEGSFASPCMDLLEMQDTMLAVRLELSPGDVLYSQGSASQYAYIMESGLLQCHTQRDGLGLPDAVSYAGPREWVGLYGALDRHQESVHAVVKTSLLAFHVGQLRHLSASSPRMAELLASRSSTALKRNGCIADGLRHLPADARTVGGLSHLLGLIDPKIEAVQGHSTMHAVLDMAVLGHWLGLSWSDLLECLTKLQGHGALTMDARNIVDVSPQLLFSASGLIAPHPSGG